MTTNHLMSNEVDIRENDILQYDPQVFSMLLIDRSKSKECGKDCNIIWGTDNYVSQGEGYGEWDEITPEKISGENGLILRPRVNKSKEEQEHRSRDKAEVFTAAWICNKQNNLVDGAWFGGKSPFNFETDTGWAAIHEKIKFPQGKTWEDYVRDTRLEMACGEAPYLVSRYDVVAGSEIYVADRIGLLDRKLRVIGENVTDEKEWFTWVVEAYKSIYGFEWQGDNLVLAREAMIYTFFDYFQDKFGKMPSKTQTRKIAEIVSWNLWQMDGLKGVIPGSCHEDIQEEYDLFGESTKTTTKCPGCVKGDITRHNGTYCYIKDWSAKKTVRFIDLLNE